MDNYNTQESSGYSQQNSSYDGNKQGSYNSANQNSFNYSNSQLPPSKPDSNLVWAILCTVLCCLPFGIVSIVYAAKVDSLWYSGRQQEANDASNSAKKWALWGAIISLVGTFLYIMIYVVILGATFSLPVIMSN